jgi:hypothetical protein
MYRSPFELQLTMCADRQEGLPSEYRAQRSKRLARRSLLRRRSSSPSRGRIFLRGVLRNKSVDEEATRTIPQVVRDVSLRLYERKFPSWTRLHHQQSRICSWFRENARQASAVPRRIPCNRHANQGRSSHTFGIGFANILLGLM